VIKLEYVVDVDRGLIVGLREYWHAVLGSGAEEELAATDIVTRWSTYSEISVPVAGHREQLVDVYTAEEGPGHRVDQMTWRIEFERVNEPFDPGEFGIDPLRPGRGTSLQ
jgi:hypothetical protein